MDTSRQYEEMCQKRNLIPDCIHETTETKSSGEYYMHPFLGEIEGVVEVCTKCGKVVKWLSILLLQNVTVNVLTV